MGLGRGGATYRLLGNDLRVRLCSVRNRSMRGDRVRRSNAVRLAKNGRNGALRRFLK